MNQWMVCGIAAVTALLAGCSTGDQEWKQLPEASRTLGAGESNRTVQVRVGEYVKISLKANPTTGYTWFFRVDKDNRQAGSAVELVGERLIMPEENNQLVGAPGVKEVMVRAVEPGFASVIGECRRPWEHGQRPALTVKYGFAVVR